jgi:hypothetical protein
MKKFVFSLSFIAVSLFALSQDNVNIKAMIDGHKTNDTIRIADCSRLTQVSLNNKDYSVLSFTLSFSDKGFDYEYVSKSNKFTEEMKSALSKLILKDDQIKYMAIKDINVQSGQNSHVKVGNLIYKLKM